MEMRKYKKRSIQQREKQKEKYAKHKQKSYHSRLYTKEFLLICLSVSLKTKKKKKKPANTTTIITRKTSIQPV